MVRGFIPNPWKCKDFVLKITLRPACKGEALRTTLMGLRLYFRAALILLSLSGSEGFITNAKEFKGLRMENDR